MDSSSSNSQLTPDRSPIDVDRSSRSTPFGRLHGLKRSCSGNRDKRHMTSPRRNEDRYGRSPGITNSVESHVDGDSSNSLGTTIAAATPSLKVWARDWSHAGDHGRMRDPLSRLQNHDYYYNSYGKLEIHQEMLGDQVRTDAYRRAILDNAHLFQGKTVLDVGSGTGILSMFAAQAGAEHVYGVEFSEIVEVARAVAAANGFGDRITYIEGEVEEVELPVDKVDIIVSEWMGYCLLYEAMLDSVLYARDKWLTSEGFMLPDRACLYVAGISAWEDVDLRKHSWDNMGGIRMSCVREELSTEPVVTDLAVDKVCTSTACALELDLFSCTSADLAFVAQIRLPSIRRDIVTGLVLWFDVSFTFGYDPSAMAYSMSTGPDSTSTHWRQTVLYFDDFCPLAHGEYGSKDVLLCTLGMRKSPRNPRDLDIKVVYGSVASAGEGRLGATASCASEYTKMYRMR